MDQQSRQRKVTSKQKQKLLELITKHPVLITGRVTEDLSYLDFQRMWQLIANECNAVPGARKTWRQWRKTWQDLRSKTKKQQISLNGAVPSSVVMLTKAEQEALGITNVEDSSCQETTEFVPLETDSTQASNFQDEIEEAPSLSEPESPPETKVFTQAYNIKKQTSKSKRKNACIFNCDLLSVHEQRKLQLKEDYINYKKDYLRKKLKIMKEQTEALRAIARELSEK